MGERDKNLSKMADGGHVTFARQAKLNKLRGFEPFVSKISEKEIDIFAPGKKII